MPTPYLHQHIDGKHGRPISYDLRLPDGQETETAPLIIFCHGFKGFKDWGHWHLIGERFAEAGFAFCAMNFSHNGTTLDAPQDFADLEAFGQNNFMIELDDLASMIAHLTDPTQPFANRLQANNICLIGHSRAGGIVLLTALEDERVKKVITWASIYSFDKFGRDYPAVAQWREDGVIYSKNGRTQQQMPLYYQLYESCVANAERLDYPQHIKALDKPYLIVHGSKDPAVPFAAAESLHALAPNSQLVRIEDGDHVFGGRHPFTDVVLPEHSAELVGACLAFLQE